MAEEQCFYRNDEEWNAFAERLKQIACPHCKSVSTLNRHGHLYGFDEVNPRNNLAHCFACNKNLNLLLTLGYDFPSAIAILERWLERHQSRLPTTHTTPKKNSHIPITIRRDDQPVAPTFSKIHDNSDAKIHTALIWQQMRPVFGRGHFSPDHLDLPEEKLPYWQKSALPRHGIHCLRCTH